MTKVTVLPEVRAYLQNLALILYEKEYFGFEEAARKYVIELFNDITTNLPTRVKKRLRSISTNTVKGCTTLYSKKTNVHRGMSFSGYTR